eukprot:772687_1
MLLIPRCLSRLVYLPRARAPPTPNHPIRCRAVLLGTAVFVIGLDRMVSFGGPHHSVLVPPQINQNVNCQTVHLVNVDGNDYNGLLLECDQQSILMTLGDGKYSFYNNSTFKGDYHILSTCSSPTQHASFTSIIKAVQRYAQQYVIKDRVNPLFLDKEFGDFAGYFIYIHCDDWMSKTKYFLSLPGIKYSICLFLLALFCSIFVRYI